MIDNEASDVRALVRHALRESTEVKNQLADTQGEQIARAAEVCFNAIKSGKKIIVFGNGGSAGDAQHIAAELIGRFRSERGALPAIALATDSCTLTAISNDFGFEAVFARQLEGLGQNGDVALAISTSGQSPNVLAAVRSARRLGLRTVGLAGGDGGRLAQEVEIPVIVPSLDSARIQEAHITIGHILCEYVDTMVSSEREVGETTPEPQIRARDKIFPLDELLKLRAAWADENKVVVWTNGCFDLLHLGHTRSLEQARSLGDVLVVGTNSDQMVSTLKGRGRPVVPEAERAELLASLASVNAVTVFDALTPTEIIRQLKPDIHAKGEEYAGLPEEEMPESAVVRQYGGRVVFLDHVFGCSTSSLVSHIISQ